ncbi:MAG: PaaI family thioesterase [Pseudomonadota bacterium]
MADGRASFGNPFLESLGVTLEAWSPGHAEFRLVLRPELGNRSGRVQGGVLCTLLDAAAGYAGLYAPDGAPERHSVSLSLTTNFLNSADGSVLVARGQVQREGRSVYFSQAQVLLDGTLVLATALGTFKYLHPR